MVSPNFADFFPSATDRASTGRSLKILVVDDEAPVREVLSELLKLDGHRVEVAIDGADALVNFGRRPADVVLTDFAMPGMDGGRLAAEIKRIAPGVPVILVTGAKPRKIDPAAIEAVVEKPFTHRSVTEAIERSLAPQP